MNLIANFQLPCLSTFEAYLLDLWLVRDPWMSVNKLPPDGPAGCHPHQADGGPQAHQRPQDASVPQYLWDKDNSTKHQNSTWHVEVYESICSQGQIWFIKAWFLLKCLKAWWLTCQTAEAAGVNQQHQMTQSPLSCIDMSAFFQTYNEQHLIHLIPYYLDWNVCSFDPSMGL